MLELNPIHRLRSQLENARLREIEALAAPGRQPDIDALRALAHLQAALTAVREEIEAHAVKVGGGSEQPLE